MRGLILVAQLVMLRCFNEITFMDIIQVGVNVARSSKKKNPLRQSQWVPVGSGQCPSGVLV